MSEFNESVSGVETVKKRKKAPIIAGTAAGVVAAAACGSLIAYNTSDFVKNKVKLATLSPEKYYAWVNNVNTNEQIEYLAKSYGEYIDHMCKDSDKGVGADMNLTYTMSDGIKTLAKNAMGNDEEFNSFIDNINDISLNFNESMLQNLIEYNLGLDFNGNNLMNLEMSMDYENLFIMGRIPQLTEKYLGFDYKAYMDSMGEYMDDEELTAMEKSMQMCGNPEEILTEDEFRSLMEKYVSIWNECVSDVQQEKNSEITVGSYTNEYTVLTVELNKNFIDSTAEKYINTIKEDAILKDIIVTRLEICDEETYISDLDSALEEIKSGGDSVLNLSTYVDPNGTIRGYSLLDSANDGFEFIFTGESEEKANGIFTFNDSESDIEVKSNIDFVAENDKYTGSVDVTVNDSGENTKVLVGFTDLETVNEEYGYMNGNLSVSVNDSAPFALALNSDGNSQKASFDLDIEDVNYGNIAIEISSKEVNGISVPDKSGAYMVDENTASLDGYATEDEVVNFVASIIKNVGLAETDEEAKQIVEYYLYGSSVYDDITTTIQ